MIRNNLKTLCVTAVLLLVVLLSITTGHARAQSEELRRPTRPDAFNSPEEVAQYVKTLQEYLRAKSVRFGKRGMLLPAELKIQRVDDENSDELAVDEQISEENPREYLAQHSQHPHRRIAYVPLMQYLMMRNAYARNSDEIAANQN